MYRTVVLDGEMSLIGCFDGDCSLEIPESGEIGVITTINEGALPAYTGETVITPTEEKQVLSTAQTSVLTDITVNPIPSNYGLVTRIGSVLRIT